MILPILAVLIGCAAWPAATATPVPSSATLRPTASLTVQPPYPPDAYPAADTLVYIPPAPSETPTFGPSPTLPPTVTDTPSPTDTATSTLTPTFRPYSGQPFKIVFLRNGNLWLAEIGGQGEHQLTHETDGWRVIESDISPRGDKIAYFAVNSTAAGQDALIKQVSVADGTVSSLEGENDTFLEYGPQWLDETHLAYKYSQGQSMYRTPIPMDEFHPDEFFILDTATGSKTYLPGVLHFSVAPNGKFWVKSLCPAIEEPNCKFELENLATHESWQVAEDVVEGRFLGWSSNSRWMIFKNKYYAHEENDDYLLFDTQLRTAKWLHLSTFSHYLRWATQSAIIAYLSCERSQDLEDKNCKVKFINPDGSNAKTDIPLHANFGILSWTSDDQKLILYSNKGEGLWIINMDGSGFQQIFRNFDQVDLLPVNK